MLNVSGSASPGSQFASSNEGSPASDAATSPPGGNGFALEFLTLLQSCGPSDKSSVSAALVTGDQVSQRPNPQAIPIASAATVTAAASQMPAKRTRIPEMLLLSGRQRAYSLESAAQSTRAIHMDNASKDSSLRQSATGYLLPAIMNEAVAAQSISTIATTQNTVAAMPPRAGNAPPKRSSKFAEQPETLPAYSVASGLVPLSLAPPVALIGAVQQNANMQGAFGHIRSDAAGSMPAHNLSPETLFQSIREGEAASLAEAPPASSIEQGVLATRAELAFGARVNSASIPTQEQPVGGRTEGLLTIAGRDKSDAPEVPAAASVLLLDGKRGGQSASSFERSADGQNGRNSQRQQFDEIAPAAISPPGSQFATNFATPRPAVPTTTLFSADPLREESSLSSKGPMRELSLKVAGEGVQSAEVRLVERNGEIQVAVRASDPRLAESLRSNVSELVSSLSRTELSAEIWHPGMAAQKSLASDARQDADGRGAASQPDNQSSSHSGDKQHGREDRRTPAWLEEIDTIPSKGSAGRNTNDTQSSI